MTDGLPLTWRPGFVSGERRTSVRGGAPPCAPGLDPDSPASYNNEQDLMAPKESGEVVRVITVGAPRVRWVREAVEEFRRRTPPPWRWVWTVVDPERASASATQAIAREGERIRRRIDADDRVVVLDAAGEGFTSEALASRVQGWLDDGRSTVLVIGGAYGLDSHVKERAQLMWSLSPLTLSHDLALVVMAEQLYRAWAIRTGHPYHK
jgi:23S rRNA (pseudouridine1915-N3)-methyltransferase